MSLATKEGLSGYESLKRSVVDDCEEHNGTFNENGCNKCTSACFHSYCDKYRWTINRAKQYGDLLGLDWQKVLTSWEEDRNYWYMNYYQECNQPEIKSDKVRVFETVDEMYLAIGEQGFRCPCCGGISSNPTKCDSGKKTSGKTCDWKAYGLFGDLGKGVFVYCKDKLKGQTIFMPLAWEGTT